MRKCCDQQRVENVNDDNKHVKFPSICRMLLTYFLEGLFVRGKAGMDRKNSCFFLLEPSRSHKFEKTNKL